MTGEARYDTLLAEVRSAHPRPCLSIVCDH